MQSVVQQRLWQACKAGELTVAQQLTQDGADPFWQDDNGQNALMVASQEGQLEIVEWLLSLGVPWNALDKTGRCAGDYALEANHDAVTEALLSAGCRAELILSALERKSERAPTESSFLLKDVEFRDSAIVDSKGEAVMMQWEASLMEAHAEALCVRGNHVLNVGFGMGLIDAAIQRRHPKSHTIIEAHPQIYAQMAADGWTQRPGVRVVFGKWQDVIGELSGFDAVFFDTYGEHYSDLQSFHAELPRLLNPDGVYSFFNGLAPDNAFFHRVYCEIVKTELATLGLSTQFVALPLSVAGGAVWEKIRNRYWWSDVYNLPVAHLEAKYTVVKHWFRSRVPLLRL